MTGASRWEVVGKECLQHRVVEEKVMKMIFTLGVEANKGQHILLKSSKNLLDFEI